MSLISESPAYDLFVSYARRDNCDGQVTALVEQFTTDYRAFAGRDLRVFFDIVEIKGMDDWRERIQRSLRKSHIFLAVLSPSYLDSPYCRWEWEDYVRYEAMRQCLGEGVAPVFFVTLPDAADPKTDQAIARWIDEIQRRQAFDLRPWHDHGETALQETHVKSTLEQLHASVRDRLDRAERARRSPNNLLKHNTAFVGRVRELTALRNALGKNKLGVVGAKESAGKSLGRVSLQGLGGMGKTELALAYAHAFAWDYPGGRWQVPCDHISDLRLALSRLAGPMGFEFTENEQKSLPLQFERVLREINRRERCLLVLDNVSDPQLLEPEHLDRLPRNGHVDLIATTRLAPPQIPGSSQDQTFIAVDELPEDDALALMRSHQPEGWFPSEAEDQEARDIVTLLEGFTLAVETAAIYLGRHPAPDACRAFRERLQINLLEESEGAAGDSAVAVRHRERLLKNTLAFTFETLPPEVLHLLTLSALLPADQVAVPWLQALAADRFPHFKDGNGASSSAFRQAMDLLLGLRLFQSSGVLDADGWPLVVRVHRLVQDLMKRDLPLEELDKQQNAVDALAKKRATELRNTVRWEDARWELGPLDALANLWADTAHPDAAWLLNHAGFHWHALAEWTRVEPLERRALEIDVRKYGMEHPEVATALNNLAQLLKATNRLAEAEDLMRRALSIWEKTLGQDHPNVASALNNLARMLQDTNRLSEAEPMFRRALAINEKAFGPDHPNVASVINSLAGLLQTTNRLGDAESLQRRALAIDEKCYGPEHPKVAIRVNNLAALLQTTNRLREAEPLMRRALAIDTQTFGPEHPLVATRLVNLAGLLKATNRHIEAEPMLRRALAIFEQSFGPEHPNVAIALNNLTGLLQETNRLSEAEPLLRRALAIDEQSLGYEHPNVAADLNNLAALLQETSRFEDAEPLLRRALTIREKSHGPEHPEVASALGNLAHLLQATNRMAEAEPLMCQALSIDEQSFGPEHPNVAVRLNNLAALLQETNRQSEAEPLVRRVLAIFEKSLGSEHPSVATALNNLAQLLRATNRLAEAEPLMRRALTIDEQSFGQAHPNVAIRLNNLARLLEDTNRLAEAEPLMRQGLEILLKFTIKSSHQHPHLQATLGNYAQLLKATGLGEEEVRRCLDALLGEYGMSLSPRK